MGESVPRRTLIRIDANYGSVDGPRSLVALAQRALTTLERYRAAGDTVLLIARRGQPVIAPRDSFQRIRTNNPTLQLTAFAQVLAELLGSSVARQMLVSLPTVQIPAYRITPWLLLVENLAFDEREDANDQVLARQLAALADHYVVDDLRALNDTVASVVSIPKAIPTVLSDAVADELALLDRLVSNPPRPFVAVLGGNQVARTLALIRRLGSSVDELLLGGVVANTFLASRGVDLQRTIVDRAEVDTAKQLAGLLGSKLTLPTDFVWRMGRVMDVGPQSRARFARSVRGAGTLLLIGPLGVTSPQLEAFRHGTLQLLEAIRPERTELRVALGDDTIELIGELNQAARFTRLCVGDSAAIDYLAGQPLAGLEAIRKSRFTGQTEF